MKDRVSDTPKIICLTPVKNEEWILHRFLRAASLWADIIVVADQGSTDDSKGIARQYEKVVLVANPSSDFNEPMRQQLLVDEARKIEGPKLLVALDADEFLSGNFMDSNEWQRICCSQPGTVVFFEWANIAPSFELYWASGTRYPFAYSDDGHALSGRQIHSPRVPVPVGAPRVEAHDVKVMHFQYTDWDRMESKHRWYACWEELNGSMTPLRTYRMYHHMIGVRKRDLLSVPKDWFAMYEAHGVDLCSAREVHGYWWDIEVLRLMRKHGTDCLSRQAIWDLDWEAKARSMGDEGGGHGDPRGLMTRLIHRYLRVSQPFSRSMAVRVMDRALDCLWR